MTNTGTDSDAVGGAIFIENDANKTVSFKIGSNALFENNSANDGGAIFVKQDTITTSIGDNAVFTGNSATGSGGAIVTAAALELNGASFTGNTAGESGGAISSTNNLTLTDTSFINNSAAQGGAVYSTADVTVNALNTDVTFSGNTASDGGDIYMATKDSNLNLNTSEDRIITIASGISGTADKFNTNLTGDGMLNLQSALNNTNMTVTDAALWLNQGSQINNSQITMNENSELLTLNNQIDSFAPDTFKLNGNVDLAVDVDLSGSNADNFKDAVDSSSTGKFVLEAINPVGNTTANSVTFNIFDLTGLTADQLAISNPDEIIAAKVLTPIRYLQGSVSTDGTVSYNPTGNSYNDFNPAIMGASVAAQLGGYLTQLNSYDEAFRNMDMYMLMTKSQRQAMKNANKYAAGDSDLVYSPLSTPYSDKAGWFRPYGTFESVGLKNGPKVSNVAYGTFIGLDSEMYELSNGWDTMFSVYAGYNGSHQAYQGNSIYQNGGSLGLVGMAYKDNFFTGLTANVGSNVGELDTMYGSEDFTMLMTGIASKTGYNFELADGKFIIQPSYLMSYSFVNTFDYTNAAGVRINSDPLNAIHIEPGLKFIGNLKNGWQPYAGVSFVWNIMDKTQFKANDVSLPELSVKPYIKYGVGVRKTWGERLTGFLQAFVTNGGRDGVGLQGGFRFTLGSDPGSKKANSSGEKKYIKAKA